MPVGARPPEQSVPRSRASATRARAVQSGQDTSPQFSARGLPCPALRHRQLILSLRPSPRLSLHSAPRSPSTGPQLPPPSSLVNAKMNPAVNNLVISLGAMQGASPTSLSCARGNWGLLVPLFLLSFWVSSFHGYLHTCFYGAHVPGTAATIGVLRVRHLRAVYSDMLASSTSLPPSAALYVFARNLNHDEHEYADDAHGEQWHGGSRSTTRRC